VNDLALGSIPIKEVLGVSIHGVSMDQCVTVCEQAIASQRRLTIGVVNAAKLVKMRSDRLLRDSVTGADLIVADGMAVIWASRVLGQPLPGRVTGIDLFEGLLALANRKELSVYVLAVTHNVLETLVKKVRSDYPGAKVAGQHDGYFSEAEAEQVATEISSVKPDMLFVGKSPVVFDSLDQGARAVAHASYRNSNSPHAHRIPLVDPVIR